MKKSEESPEVMLSCNVSGAAQAVREEDHDLINELKLKIAQIKEEAAQVSFDRNNLEQYGIDEEDSNNAMIDINAVIT